MYFVVILLEAEKIPHPHWEKSVESAGGYLLMSLN